jgi:hypothetical protein
MGANYGMEGEEDSPAEGLGQPGHLLGTSMDRKEGLLFFLVWKYRGFIYCSY